MSWDFYEEGLEEECSCDPGDFSLCDYCKKAKESFDGDLDEEDL